MLNSGELAVCTTWQCFQQSTPRRRVQVAPALALGLPRVGPETIYHDYWDHAPFRLFASGIESRQSYCVAVLTDDESLRHAIIDTKYHNVRMRSSIHDHINR